MGKSTVLDTRSHGYQMLFRDAARLTLKALKREGGDPDILLSHALSDIDENDRWHVRDISGTDVAIIIGNEAYLIDESAIQAGDCDG